MLLPSPLSFSSSPPQPPSAHCPLPTAPHVTRYMQPAQVRIHTYPGAYTQSTIDSHSTPTRNYTTPVNSIDPYSTLTRQTKSDKAFAFVIHFCFSFIRCTKLEEVRTFEERTGERAYCAYDTHLVRAMLDVCTSRVQQPWSLWSVVVEIENDVYILMYYLVGTLCCVLFGLLCFFCSIPSSLWIFFSTVTPLRRVENTAHAVCCAWRKSSMIDAPTGYVLNVYVRVVWCSATYQVFGFGDKRGAGGGGGGSGAGRGGGR